MSLITTIIEDKPVNIEAESLLGVLPDISPLVSFIIGQYSAVISRVVVPGVSWGPAAVGNILYRVVPYPSKHSQW